MKTYPILREDGTLNGFEVSSTTSYGTISGILGSVPGVRDIKRTRHTDTRLTFVFNDIDCEVLEPYGDSSRYWIGAVHPDKDKINIDQLHEAFIAYRGPIARILQQIGKRADQKGIEK